MHKDFYASGFLFHSSTQQILLQQLDTQFPQWSLFSGEKNTAATPSEVFQRVINQHLKIKLSQQSILPIYDYFHTELNKNHYLLYAIVNETDNIRIPNKNVHFAWFNFKQIHKLVLTDQTRQDITVGQRVINALLRSTAESGAASLLNKA